METSSKNICDQLLTEISQFSWLFLNPNDTEKLKYYTLTSALSEPYEIFQNVLALSHPFCSNFWRQLRRACATHCCPHKETQGFLSLHESLQRNGLMDYAHDFHAEHVTLEIFQEYLANEPNFPLKSILTEGERFKLKQNLKLSQSKISFYSNNENEAHVTSSIVKYSTRDIQVAGNMCQPRTFWWNRKYCTNECICTESEIEQAINSVDLFAIWTLNENCEFLARSRLANCQFLNILMSHSIINSVKKQELLSIKNEEERTRQLIKHIATSGKLDLINFTRTMYKVRHSQANHFTRQIILGLFSSFNVQTVNVTLIQSDPTHPLDSQLNMHDFKEFRQGQWDKEQMYQRVAGLFVKESQRRPSQCKMARSLNCLYLKLFSSLSVFYFRGNDRESTSMDLERIQIMNFDQRNFQKLAVLYIENGHVTNFDLKNMMKEFPQLRTLIIRNGWGQHRREIFDSSMFPENERSLTLQEVFIEPVAGKSVRSIQEEFHGEGDPVEFVSDQTHALLSPRSDGFERRGIHYPFKDASTWIIYPEDLNEAKHVTKINHIPQESVVFEDVSEVRHLEFREPDLVSTVFFAHNSLPPKIPDKATGELILSIFTALNFIEYRQNFDEKMEKPMYLEFNQQTPFIGDKIDEYRVHFIYEFRWGKGKNMAKRLGHRYEPPKAKYSVVEWIPKNFANFFHPNRCIFIYVEVLDLKSFFDVPAQHWNIQNGEYRQYDYVTLDYLPEKDNDPMGIDKRPLSLPFCLLDTIKFHGVKVTLKSMEIILLETNLKTFQMSHGQFCYQGFPWVEPYRFVRANGRVSKLQNLLLDKNVSIEEDIILTMILKICPFLQNFTFHFSTFFARLEKLPEFHAMECSEIQWKELKTFNVKNVLCHVTQKENDLIDIFPMVRSVHFNCRHWRKVDLLKFQMILKNFPGLSELEIISGVGFVDENFDGNGAGNLEFDKILKKMKKISLSEISVESKVLENILIGGDALEKFKYKEIKLIENSVELQKQDESFKISTFFQFLHSIKNKFKNFESNVQNLEIVERKLCQNLVDKNLLNLTCDSFPQLTKLKLKSNLKKKNWRENILEISKPKMNFLECVHLSTLNLSESALNFILFSTNAKILILDDVNLVTFENSKFAPETDPDLNFSNLDTLKISFSKLKLNSKLFYNILKVSPFLNEIEMLSKNLSVLSIPLNYTGANFNFFQKLHKLKLFNVRLNLTDDENVELQKWWCSSLQELDLTFNVMLAKDIELNCKISKILNSIVHNLKSLKISVIETSRSNLYHNFWEFVQGQEDEDAIKENVQTPKMVNMSDILFECNNFKPTPQILNSLESFSLTFKSTEPMNWGEYKYLFLNCSSFLGNNLREIELNSIFRVSPLCFDSPSCLHCGSGVNRPDMKKMSKVLFKLVEITGRQVMNIVSSSRCLQVLRVEPSNKEFHFEDGEYLRRGLVYDGWKNITLKRPPVS